MYKSSSFLEFKGPPRLTVMIHSEEFCFNPVVIRRRQKSRNEVFDVGFRKVSSLGFGTESKSSVPGEKDGPFVVSGSDNAQTWVDEKVGYRIPFDRSIRVRLLRESVQPDGATYICTIPVSFDVIANKTPALEISHAKQAQIHLAYRSRSSYIQHPLTTIYDSLRERKHSRIQQRHCPKRSIVAGDEDSGLGREISSVVRSITCSSNHPVL